jgi:hypothetical protein
MTLGTQILLPGPGQLRFSGDVSCNHAVPSRRQLAADLGANSSGASSDKSEPPAVATRRRTHTRSASHRQIAGGISFCDLLLT